MKQNKMKIAITGGIGSGKSTVCKMIEGMGYPVFSCDKTYSELLNSGCLTDELVKEFGTEILDSDGKLSRRNLSELVFASEEKLDRLNKITHPKIFDKMFCDAERCGNDVCFFEVPILFECGYEKLFDKIIVVFREVEERIKSVMARDNLSREEVVSRINKQFNYDNCDFTKYYVIHNCCNIDSLSGKIKQLLSKIINS